MHTAGKLPYIFFHPDYTVGPGISPDPAFRLAGFTAGRESHPALKIVIFLIMGLLYSSPFCFSSIFFHIQKYRLISFQI